jgi:toxin CcdB
VIVPLRRVSAKQRLQQKLNPEFSVDGVQVYADMADIGAFPLGLLRRPVASLRAERLPIEDALDFLFTGF